MLFSSLSIKTQWYKALNKLEVKIIARHPINAVIGILTKDSKVRLHRIIFLDNGENTETFLDDSIVPGDDYLVIINRDKRTILYSSKILQ